MIKLPRISDNWTILWKHKVIVNKGKNWKTRKKMNHDDKKADRFERGPNKLTKTEKYGHWNQTLEELSSW